MLLFFYDSGDHPHLHSFPTRRSSDLAIGSRVLVRVFEHRLEIRDLKTQALLRSHERVERPGSVVLPMERSEEHTSELQSHSDLVCRLLLEKKKNTTPPNRST